MPHLIWLFVTALFASSVLSAIPTEGAAVDTNQTVPPTSQTAIFAGGCFWCMQKPFDNTEGVLDTEVGFTGGHLQNPSYKQVSSGGTGHLEVIQVTYDPSQVSYDELLSIFWVNVDPTDAGGQFCDRGSEYTTAIFARNDQQKQLAEQSLNALQASNILEKTIVTPIRQAQTFYPAEQYHQDYYLKNPIRYNYYRYRCGRDNRLNALWKNANLPILDDPSTKKR
jgi:peptide-methionine (S)-S-oxide reductase